ncbi:MAG TPA: diguanylate cyclase [Syntrophorhabdaceae bacterium]|nr:diguanylate cyclase [Syntrophorhabdaceae bacterium]HOL05032.1 diguanylate cyclase [Syntrophorhabdaceae bacterium]HPP41256.1 diguanylate cyclase [Syntrophorhabdaceae bacterium]
MLLKSVSKRLSDAIRKTDTVARMGGDEFLIIIPAISAIDYIETVAKKIIKELLCRFYNIIYIDIC